MVVMGDHDKRLVMFPHNLLHQFQNLHRCPGIQVSGRLVGKDNLRMNHQRPGNSHTLLLSLPDIWLGMCLPTFSRPTNSRYFFGPCLSVSSWEFPGTTGAAYILHRIHCVQQVIGLKDGSRPFPF